MSPTELVDALAGVSVQFPGSEPDLRLGGDRDLLAAAVGALEVEDLERLLTSEVASHPSLKTPLSAVPPKSGGHREVLLGAVLEWGDDESGLVVVHVGVETTGKSFKPIAHLDLGLEVVEGDEIAERLELAFQQTPRAARTMIDPRRLTWLGGSAGTASGTPHDWEDEIRALGAVRGFDATVLVEPDRRPKDVEIALAKRAPELLVHWLPHAARVSDVVDKLREGGMDVLTIETFAYADAAAEVRAALDEMIDPTPIPAAPPGSGETRFYIKGYGSKVGDKMIEVPDCGHGDWGSNAKAKAPRAYKGAALAAGAEPSHLALCGKCSKNRWRARF